MAKTFGGICDGCGCGFSLTSALSFMGDRLLCSECTEAELSDEDDYSEESEP